jgi:hypothetical protein
MVSSDNPEAGESEWLVGNAALSHDFVVPDDKLSSLLSTTSLILIGARFGVLVVLNCACMSGFFEFMSL